MLSFPALGLHTESHKSCARILYARFLYDKLLAPRPASIQNLNKSCARIMYARFMYDKFPAPRPASLPYLNEACVRILKLSSLKCWALSLPDRRARGRRARANGHGAPCGGPALLCRFEFALSWEAGPFDRPGPDSRCPIHTGCARKMARRI